jgi:hypothetical protein
MISCSACSLRSTGLTVSGSGSSPSSSRRRSGNQMRWALRQRSSSRCGMAAAGSTKSTWPVAMAARGISSYSASSGHCARVSPPFSFTRLRPTAPSEPVPENTAQTARSSCTCASARKNRSIATCGPRVRDGSVTRSHPSFIDRSRLGAITYTRLASIGIGAVTCMTGMPVLRCRISAALLSWWGDRCRTTTKAIPLSAGIVSKKRCRAARPPAEAPMPTTGKVSELFSSGGRSASGSVGIDGSDDMKTPRRMLTSTLRIATAGRRFAYARASLLPTGRCRPAGSYGLGAALAFLLARDIGLGDNRSRCSATSKPQCSLPLPNAPKKIWPI